MRPARSEVDPPANAPRSAAEAPRQEDLDRLAAALAALLAAWWRRHEDETAAPGGAATSEEVKAAIDLEGHEEAPAPTGAGEIHPEHDTRKETTS
jgi:hypothetical protein